MPTNTTYLPDAAKFQFSISRLIMAMLATALLMVIDIPYPTFDLTLNKILLTVGSVAAILLYDPGKKWLSKASHWTAEGRFEEAIEACDEYIERYPGKPDGYAQRGFVYFHADELETAIVDFDRALERDQRCGHALLGKALCHMQAGNWEPCFELLEQAKRPRDSRGAAFYWHGFVSLLVGDIDQTKADAQRAVKYPDYFQDAHELLARVALLEKRYHDLLSHVEFAATEGAIDADLAILHAIGEYKLGRHESAIRDIDIACEEKPNSASGWATYSWFLSTCTDDSLRDGNRALELAMLAKSIEDDWTAWSSIAAAQAELGNFDRAVEWAQKVVERTGEFRREEMQQRLETYKAGKPFRDHGMAAV